MAEFCNKCAEEMGFPSADIDIYAIAENNLKEGEYMPTLCEGCGMVAIGKGEDGKIMLAYPSGETSHNPDETMVNWIYIEEYESQENHLKN
jgi:hypothetical protein